MSKDPEFQKAEKTLYTYYENIKRIEAIKNTNITLSNQLKDIEKRLKTNSFFSLDVSFGGISYEERVQTSINTTSCQEKAIFKWAERLEKEKQNTEERIFYNLQKIREIEKNGRYIKAFVDNLDSIDKSIVEGRYRDNLKGKELWEKIALGHNSENVRRKKIINKFIKWMEE